MSAGAQIRAAMAVLDRLERAHAADRDGELRQELRTANRHLLQALRDLDAAADAVHPRVPLVTRTELRRRSRARRDGD